MVSRALAPDELALRIVSGEDSFTEFKESAVSTKHLAKELCAFLNTNGGLVMIGVRDDGTVVGRGGEWGGPGGEERVMNVARTLLDPPVIPTFQVVRPPGSDAEVAVVSVDPGPEKPYALSTGEGKRYFVRAGTTTREASREELLRLTQASGSVVGDLRPALGAALADLDDELIAGRFAKRRSVDWPALSKEGKRQVLLNAEILHRETGGPTIAGLLCFGRAPQDRMSFATVNCVAYRGIVVERELQDRATIGGRIEQQVENAVAFIERNLRSASTVEGIRRIEAPRPPEDTLREVLANAVVHRHYGIVGPCQVRVFADRLEVQSPGGLPNGVTPEAMRIGVSVRRNPFLVDRLVELGLVDAVGRGFVLMVEEALALGLPEPQVRTPEGFVEVVIPLVNATQ